jgi:hypothetical protein
MRGKWTTLIMGGFVAVSLNVAAFAQTAAPTTNTQQAGERKEQRGARLVKKGERVEKKGAIEHRAGEKLENHGDVKAGEKLEKKG